MDELEPKRKEVGLSWSMSELSPAEKEFRDLIARELHKMQRRWAGGIMQIVEEYKLPVGNPIVMDWVRRMTMKWENLEVRDRFLLRIEAMDLVNLLKDLGLVSFG